VSTPKGKGALADPHPLAVGALTAGHPALARADLVILLGVDEGELPPGVLPAGTRVARIGRAPWSGGVFVAEALGDLSLVIEELAPYVRARPAADWDVAELDRMKRSLVQAVTSSPEARLVAMAREATPAGTLATGDVPALAAWQAVAPRETLSPLGPTPGYAVLAGLAAQLAHTDRRVLAFTNPTGLAAGGATLRQVWMLGLPLIVVVFGEVQTDTAATMDGAGVELRSCRGEGAFGLELSRAFLAGQPAVIAVRSER